LKIRETRLYKRKKHLHHLSKNRDEKRH